MKILVTGGAGYIGSILVPELLNKGYEVTVIDSFLFGQQSLLESCNQEKLTIIRDDVRNQNLLLNETNKSDCIIPLACLTGAPLCNKDPVGAQQINFYQIKFIADKKSKDQMLIFPCTNSGYGVGEEGVYCDEKTPMRPVSLYGKLKVEIDKYLLDQGESVTFRFATIFGSSPRMRLDLLVNDFTYRAIIDRTVVLFEANFKRNYLHVRDAAQSFIHTIENYSGMQGEPFNVGLSDANLSKKELCEAIKKEIPDFQYVISEIGKDPDQRNYIVSNDKIEATGYQTKVSLSDGIRELKKAFQIIRRNQYSNI
jgi:nucleoside-diphosphate-sugar epimerase